MRKLKTLAAFLCVSVLGAAPSAFAHGEDKPGPHGGVIRMPGAFHTEVVAQGDNAIDVYLLDINWKDPTVKDSSVSVAHVVGDRRTALTCRPRENLFSCGSEFTVLNSGSLIVKSSRLGMQGIEVTYPLPLRIQPTEKEHHEDKL